MLHGEEERNWRLHDSGLSHTVEGRYRTNFLEPLHFLDRQDILKKGEFLKQEMWKTKKSP
jgi:hypothetical protein